MSEMAESEHSTAPTAPISNSVPTQTPEIVKQCCICMRKDLKLMHLCLVNGGGNSLFSMFCDEQDDSPDGNKEPTRLIICWECDAIMNKVVRFRQQACKAQKRLSSIVEGRSMVQNTVILREGNFRASGQIFYPPLPRVSGARGAGPEAILEYRTQTSMDPSQPVLRVLRYVLPDGTSTPLPPTTPGLGSGSHSSLLDLLEGIHE